MSITDIEQEWIEDSKIDLDDLAGETRKTVSLHGKYFRYYREYGREYQKLKSSRARLVQLKNEYYLGELDKVTLDKYGWKQFQKRILKTELPSYIAADPDVISTELKIHDANYCVELLESIIKSINNRGFHIKNAIEFLKFKNGGY